MWLDPFEFILKHFALKKSYVRFSFTGQILKTGVFMCPVKSMITLIYFLKPFYKFQLFPCKPTITSLTLNTSNASHLSSFCIRMFFSPLIKDCLHPSRTNIPTAFLLLFVCEHRLVHSSGHAHSLGELYALFSHSGQTSVALWAPFFAKDGQVMFQNDEGFVNS